MARRRKQTEAVPEPAPPAPQGAKCECWCPQCGDIHMAVPPSAYHPPGSRVLNRGYPSRRCPPCQEKFLQAKAARKREG